MRNTDIYRDTYLTESEVASISALRDKRDKKFGRGRHTNTVMELPDQVRRGEAIPGAIAEILRQIEEGRSLEDMRKQGILDIGGWRIDILY
jgi:hypothetical protein